jgi:hypothetical protein
VALVVAILVGAATSAEVTLVAATLAYLSVRQRSPVVRVLAAQVLAH